MLHLTAIRLCSIGADKVVLPECRARVCFGTINMKPVSQFDQDTPQSG